MTKDIFKHINLSLFDGGAGAGAATGDGSGNGADGSAVTGQTGDDNGMAAASNNTGNSDDTANVVAPQVKSAEERRKEYDAYISGEGKEFYTADTQKMIDRRFKQTKELEGKLAEADPIISMLNQRYGTTNAQDLMAALENDTAYWEQEAYDKGFNDVESYMKFSRLERENAALMQAQKEQKAREEADHTVEQWFRQAEAMKDKFPDFDFRAELDNPQFVGLLKSGVPVEHAYKTLHFDELVAKSSTQAAQKTEAAVVDNIRARGQRPSEAGLNSQNGFTSKIDVTKLNKAQRAELAKRASRGEVISLFS